MAGIYDDDGFFSAYSQMTRSENGLRGAGEWEDMKLLLPSISGSRILDLGCGFGWHASYFMQHGAASVKAIDCSERMLERARAINGCSGISYELGDIGKTWIEEEGYDLIFSSLAIHYVEDYPALIRKAYRGLCRGGCLLFSVEHPVFTAEGSEDWCYGEDGGIRHFPVDRYFEEGERTTSFLGFPVLKLHRTLTTYVGGLLEAGFRITGLKEPEVPEHLRDLEEMRNEWRRPMMLILRASRPE